MGWQYRISDAGEGIVYDADGGRVATVQARGAPTSREFQVGLKARTAVISAAPDLLAACEEAFAAWTGDYFDGSHRQVAALNLLKAAIARAKGGT